MNDRRAIKQYQSVNTQSGVVDANPHQLIAMLINGALSRLSSAKGCIERKDFSGKGELLGKSIDIISGLQGCLDMESGGEISSNLYALYDYMVRRLTEASLTNNMEIVDEVISLLREIKAGWDGIPAELHRQPSTVSAAAV
ncbi:MAG: flagellar export chaperone FliS [Pseudomonadales bacterium]|nr:flagellar export chaperone FliS [Pseudomonadales bacterium]